MQNTQEIWKDIQGYESLYQVSNLGNVFSKRKKKMVKGCVMKDGYHDVLLCSDKQRHFKRHRLVAIAFIPNPQNKETVNHKDGNKANNCVSNLEWSTYLENNLHSINILGNKPGGRNEGHPLNKLDSTIAKRIRDMHSKGVNIDDISIEFGIHREHARKIINGVYWK